NSNKSQILCYRISGSPGPLKIVSTEPPGDIHSFTTKIQSRIFLDFQSLWMEFCCGHTATHHFCFVVSLLSSRFNVKVMHHVGYKLCIRFTQRGYFDVCRQKPPPSIHHLFGKMVVQ